MELVEAEVRVITSNSSKRIVGKIIAQEIIMNIIARIGLVFFVFGLFFQGPLSLVYAMDDPAFSIKRMAISRSIEDREPVASGDFFSSAAEELFCFLDARNIEQDATVSFIWYHENRELARVELPLQKGSRWRTWSSKKINGLKGAWKVELQDSSGIIRHTVTFTVE
jgi:hypothetical protein